MEKKIPNIPKSLSAIVNKMLEKKPSNRYSSYHELRTEFLRIKMSDEIKEMEIEEGRAVVLSSFLQAHARETQFIDITTFKLEKQIKWMRISLIVSVVANILLLIYIFQRAM